MSYNPLNNFIRMEQVQGKSSYKATAPASDQFSNLLNQVVSRNQVHVIQGNQGTQETAFRKQKEVVETGSKMRPEDDEENESVYKTVQKIEKRLIALARLERQMMAGF